MPIRSLTTSFNKGNAEIILLSSYAIDLPKLSEVRHQYMVAEVIMLRLFSIIESQVAEVALKLACNTPYRNGNRQKLHITCGSSADALSKMLSYNRTTPLPYLKWTKRADIRKNIKKVIDISSSSYYRHISFHASLLNEMRIVRNHIAHRTNSTRQQYITVTRTLYGANPKLSIGPFLISTSRHPVSNLSRYIQAAKIILDDITRG